MDNEFKYVCKCGAELPPSHEGPCPKCGESGQLHKAYEKSAHLTIGLVVSASAQKVHKYTKKHPWFISISVAFTIISLSVGYLLGALAGLLIGIIVAMLNWWLTPHAIETIVEVTHLGDKGKGAQEEKTKNDTQKPDYSHKGIYQKLEGIENKIESSTQIQKFAFIYAVGVAFIILGLSYLPLLLEHAGVATTRFYSFNISGLIAVGTFALVYAINIKKPRMTKEQKEARKKKK